MKEPKSPYSRRKIALTPTILSLLRKYRKEQEAIKDMVGNPLKETDLVFSNLDGTPLDPGTVSKTFNKAISNANLPHIRFHDLRHTHASLLLEAGVHPKIVQERLGHSNIAVTLDLYSHVVGGLQELAAQRFENTINVESIKILTNNTSIEESSVCR